MISTVQSSCLGRDECTVYNSKTPVTEEREKTVHSGDLKTAALRHITEGPADGCSPGYLWSQVWRAKIFLLLKMSCPFQGVEKDKDYNPHCKKSSINIKLSLLILTLFFLDCPMIILVVKSMERWAVRALQAPANHPWLYQGLYENI